MAQEKNNRTTKQKVLILKFIESRQNQHVRAEDILEGLAASGESVSKATVYRFLKSLEEEGSIRKYTLSDKTPACYQYVGNHPECHEHYHLMCSQCGEVMHVDSPKLKSFMQDMLEDQGFSVDAGKTVFYGMCKTCRNHLDKDKG